LYVCSRLVAKTSSFEGLIAWGGEATTNRNSIIGIDNSNKWWYGGAGISVPLGTTAGTEKVVLAKSFDGATSRGYLNGIINGTGAGVLSVCDGKILLGLRDSTSSGFASCHLYEVACFSEAHDAATVAKIVAYMRRSNSVTYP